MDNEDYNRLVTKYVDTVYRVARNGCHNVQDAQDIVQEVFCKLLKCETAFDSDEHVKRWLIRVAVNECHALYRSGWKRHEVSYADVSQLEDGSGAETIPEWNTGFYRQIAFSQATMDGQASQSAESGQKSPEHAAIGGQGWFNTGTSTDSLEIFIRNQALHQAIARLPIKWREILYLFYFEEYSVREIAQILGLSEVNVRTSAFRARAKLKNILTKGNAL